MAQGCLTQCSVAEEGYEGWRESQLPGARCPLKARAAAGFPSTPGTPAGCIPVCFIFLKVGPKRSLTSLFMKQDATESQRFIEAGTDL